MLQKVSRSMFVLSLFAALCVLIWLTFPYIKEVGGAMRAAIIQDDFYAVRHISVQQTPLTVYIAETESKRIKGLSGRESLGERYGMFFMFDETHRHGIWMKDMNFSIDIIWIDENYRVVHIEKSVSPDTYPSVFYPTTPARYVLETNAGFAEAHKFKKGDIVTLY